MCDGALSIAVAALARAEAVLRHHADGPGGAFPDLARDVVALTEELTGLREQLDAQEKSLAALAALAHRRGDDFWLNALTKELLSIAARAALGVERLRVTHGRYCRCSACARTRVTAPCGMHGACPAVYAPLPAVREQEA